MTLPKSSPNDSRSSSRSVARSGSPHGVVDQPRDSAGVRIPPPFIFIGAVVLAYTVHAIWPVSVRPPQWSGFGVLLLAAGFAMIVWAATLFRRAETEIAPWRPTTTLVTSGPYAHTRNPIYLGFALIQMGIGIWGNRLAVVLAVIPAVAATNWWVIAREEAYLERKFGDVYREYAARVRRWL